MTGSHIYSRYTPSVSSSDSDEKNPFNNGKEKETCKKSVYLPQGEKNQYIQYRNFFVIFFSSREQT